MKTIRIQEPCHEKWQNMTTCEGGKFCGVCQKTVYDFTKFTTTEAVDFLENNKDACGRFTETQLNPTHWSNRWAAKSKWLSSIAAIVLLIITACKPSRYRTTGMPVVSDNDTLYHCQHKNINSLDFMHKPNINDTTRVKK